MTHLGGVARSVLVVVLAVSTALPLWANQSSPTVKEALETIRKAGGKVTLTVNERPVTVRFEEITDAQLKGVIESLKALESVQYLELGGAELSDAGLKQLKAVKQLRRLDIGLFGPLPKITPDGLAEFQKALPKCAMNVTPAELKALRTIEKLGGTAYLTSGHRIEGIRFARIVVLDGDRRRLTDALTDAGLKDAAKELKAFKSLRSLVLKDTAITDKGLTALAQLQHLEDLTLNGKVTNKGLKELAAMKGLRTLDLRGSQVTDAGVAELQKALPNLKVVR